MCVLSLRHVNGALNEFQPDIIVYNAGTDILQGDPLGCLSITPEVPFDRDFRSKHGLSI